MTKTSDSPTGYIKTWTDEREQWLTRADGTKLRYIAAGEGPPIVLLHTVRTQLDYFQRLIPLLTSGHRVYALDFPGMGWSDIKEGATYEREDLDGAVVEFVRHLELTDVTLVGESIGAVIAMTASIELGDRVRKVVASNAYDYKPGLERANGLARFIIKSVKAPIVGPFFASQENRVILKGILRGGYFDKNRLPEPFIDELDRVGKRPGYSRVARAIYRNLPGLVAAHALYPSVKAPVTLVYSDHDWSKQADRDRTAAALPFAKVLAVENTGHFIAMERPDALASAILS